MTRSIRFHAEAIAEIRSAATWYEEKRSGLGSEFLDAVEARVEQLACPASEEDCRTLI